MAKINITVDLDWLGDEEEGAESFDDALKSEIVHGIVQKYTQNIDKDIISMSEAKIKEINQQATFAINGAIDKKIAETLDGFVNKTINIYDKWGDVKRSDVTVIELLKEKMDAFLTEKVDKSGKSGGYNADTSRLNYIIQKNITYEMERKIEVAAGKIKTELEKYMKEQLEKSVGQKMVNLLKLDECIK